MKLSVVIILFMGLISCHRQIVVVDSEKPALPQAVAGASDPAIVKLQDKLAREGVRIISMGQMYLVSIPSVLLFGDQSPRLTWKSYALLDDVVCYLQMFRKISVHVNVYSGCYLSENRARALTLARGREVANYLWSQNIDARMVIMRGMGDARPLTNDKSTSDSSSNSRVEIVFRRAVA